MVVVYQFLYDPAVSYRYTHAQIKSLSFLRQAFFLT